MGRSELITTSEIAALAGVELSTVTSWRSRHEDAFPQPVEVPDQDRRTKFFRRVEVDAFLLEHQLGKRYAAVGAIRAGRHHDALRFDHHDWTRGRDCAQ